MSKNKKEEQANNQDYFKKGETGYRVQFTTISFINCFFYLF
jgi:hypothetical protein